MRKFWIFITVGIISVALSCGGGWVPVPYMSSQKFEYMSECKKDFSPEVGDCTAIIDGEVQSGCNKIEEGCVEHFYLEKRNGRPYFTHFNARYPCYEEWVIDRYSNTESPTYRSRAYRVVSMELASHVVDNYVHVIEVLRRQDDQTPGYCYYKLEGAVEMLNDGSYWLKLWNPDRELILKTKFVK